MGLHVGKLGEHNILSSKSLIRKGFLRFFFDLPTKIGCKQKIDTLIMNQTWIELVFFNVPHKQKCLVVHWRNAKHFFHPIPTRNLRRAALFWGWGNFPRVEKHVKNGSNTKKKFGKGHRCTGAVVTNVLGSIGVPQKDLIWVPLFFILDSTRQPARTWRS